MAVRVLNGSCLCGAVRYEVEDSFDYAGFCHCSKCRRTTGAASKPYAGILRDRFRAQVDATDQLIWGDPDADYDLHCGRCGSLVYSVVRDRKWIHVPMGTLIDTPTIRPDHHIMVGSKAEWESITDGLPQYELFQDSRRLDRDPVR